MNATRRACCLSLLALCASAGAAPSEAEQARIDRLIEAVGQNRQARFIRNGTEYEAADAAAFLHRKLDAFGSRVKTVHDFIEQIASKSTTTGEIYKVRLSDGHVVTSADFLRGELARIEAKR